MSDSDLHNHFPLPTAIVGGGCGKLKGDQHLRYPDTHADRQPAPDAARSRRRADRDARRQHRQVRGGLMRAVDQSPAGAAGAAAAFADAADAAVGAARRRRRDGAAPAGVQAPTYGQKSGDGTTALHWAVHYGDAGTGAAPASRPARTSMRAMTTARRRCRRRPSGAMPALVDAAAEGRRRCRIPQRRRPDRADDGGAHRQGRGGEAADQGAAPT